jgi:molybdopterin-guanine dinucleotide biosynthesis protein A
MGCAGLILAGGQGSRMGGRDKAFCPLAGRPLIAHVCDRLARQGVRLAISANGDAGRFARFGLPVLADPMPGFPGPLAGVLAGLDWARALGFGGVVSVAVDTPFFPEDLVARLLAPGGAAVAAAADDQGVIRRHPTAAFWPVTVAPALRDWLASGERRLGGFARAVGAAEVVFARATDAVATDPMAPDPFANINTPDDLARAEERLR